MEDDKLHRPRLEQLTWLRGIAAFLVIVSHTIRATEVRYSSTDVPSYFLPLGLLDLGSYAVALFFVLSGCTLWLSNGRMTTGQDILHYYIKRIRRIWPAFMASLVIYLAFIPFFYVCHCPIFRLLRDAGWQTQELFIGGTLLSLPVASISYYGLERAVVVLKPKLQSAPQPTTPVMERARCCGEWKSVRQKQ